MNVDELTDKEAIASATLLGCTFVNIPPKRSGHPRGLWFMVYDDADELPLTPVEEETYRKWDALPQEGKPFHWGWRTQAALARDYIAWYERRKEAT